VVRTFATNGSAADEHVLTDLIYETAVDPSLWSPVHERFANAMGGVGAALLWHHQVTGEGSGLSARVDPKALQLYFGRFAAINPIRPPIERMREGMANFTPGIILDEDNITKEALVKTEFYNDFMRLFDFHSTLSVGLAAEGFVGGTVDVMRPLRFGAFNEQEIGLAGRLQPHFIRAFALGRKLAATRGLARATAEILDRSPHGLFLLGHEGRIRHVNRAGEAIAAGCRDLAIVAGRLVATAPDAARRLDCLISQASSADPERRAGGSLALTSPDRRLPLSVLVTPLRSERTPMFMGEPGVLVCVTDLEAGEALPAQRMRDLFGLSRAETRVAMALFEGLDPRGAGERLGLSFYTVRGHLARIFEKTQTHGQVELARLMMRTIGLAAG